MLCSMKRVSRTDFTHRRAAGTRRRILDAGGEASDRDRRRSVRKWFAALTALSLGGALLLSACGGGSGSDSATGVSAGSVAKFCNDANAANATLNSRLSNNIAPLGKSELTSLAAQLRTLAGEAPAQIKADLTTMGAFYDKASINGIDAVDSATTSAANAAGARFSAWGDQNCGSGSNSNNANPTSTASAGGDLSAFCADRTNIMDAISSLVTGVLAGQQPSIQAIQQATQGAARLAAEAPASVSPANGLEPTALKNAATRLSNDMARFGDAFRSVSITDIAQEVASLNTDADADCP